MKNVTGKIFKLIALSIALLCLLLSLFACNGSDTAPEGADSTSDNQEDTSSPSYQSSPLFRNFGVSDLDADGRDEIIMHDMVDAFGGAGQYELFVYAQDNSYSYKKLFDSNEYLIAHPQLDISATAVRDGVYAFENSRVEFYVEYTVNDNEYPFLFDENGNAKPTPMFCVDSFNDFELKDVDSDGTDELVLRSYCSIAYHANYLGDAVAVFKMTDGEMTLVDLRIEFYAEGEN